MSEFMSALVISGSIFAVMMVSQLGRREYSWHKIAIPLLSVGAFGWAYLRHLPTAGNAVWLYLVGMIIGGVFAVLTTWSTTAGKRPGDQAPLHPHRYGLRPRLARGRRAADRLRLGRGQRAELPGSGRHRS